MSTLKSILQQLPDGASLEIKEDINNGNRVMFILKKDNYLIYGGASRFDEKDMLDAVTEMITELNVNGPIEHIKNTTIFDDHDIEILDRTRALMISNYAKSLVKHKCYDTIEEAMVESERFFDKSAKGQEEPMKCPYHPDIETRTEELPDGSKIIHYERKINEQKE